MALTDQITYKSIIIERNNELVLTNLQKPNLKNGEQSLKGIEGQIDSGGYKVYKTTLWESSEDNSTFIDMKANIMVI